MGGKTLFDKIWDAHVVSDLGDEWVLLHIDRQLLHDLSGGQALKELAERGLPVLNPSLAFATPDHAVSSAPGRMASSFAPGAALHDALRDRAAREGIPFFGLGQDGQGIVHVIGPELGIVLPGVTLVCGDSHTCTNGALGALAFGVGSSELTHALATQTLRQRRPKRMRISIDGRCGPGVGRKDLILHVIGRFGASAGNGYAVEYAGEAVRAMTVEQVERLAEQCAGGNATVTVDLEQQLVFPPRGEPMPFRVDALRRDALLQELDDIGLTVARMADIAAFRTRDRAERPWVWLPERSGRPAAEA